MKNYKCKCAEDNKKAGKEIYDCHICRKPYIKLSRADRLKEYISYVFSKAKGSVDEEKLYKEAVDKFNKENK